MLGCYVIIDNCVRFLLDWVYCGQRLVGVLQLNHSDFQAVVISSQSKVCEAMSQRLSRGFHGRLSSKLAHSTMTRSCSIVVLYILTKPTQAHEIQTCSYQKSTVHPNKVARPYWNNSPVVNQSSELLPSTTATCSLFAMPHDHGSTGEILVQNSDSRNGDITLAITMLTSCPTINPILKL